MDFIRNRKLDWMLLLTGVLVAVVAIYLTLIQYGSTSF